ncbi:O-methyltransferase [Hymenobacter sp.]|uniref:O-methyltransferase n=1 Tax=Hymenobacter sp. TaxID=1898978 RepID=UPI0039C891E0
MPTCASTFDFILLDADRAQYVGWWPQLFSLLKHGGLLVVDNALSHQDELKSFAALLASTPGIETVLVPIGKSELLVWKGSAAKIE